MMKKKSLCRLVAEVAISSLLVALLISLRTYRYWPFSTASNDKAFLNTTFGMSIPEVERALSRSRAALFDYASYSTTVRQPLFNDLEFEPFTDEQSKRYKSLFMPSIDLFGERAEAEFQFYDEKLISVIVAF